MKRLKLSLIALLSFILTLAVAIFAAACKDTTPKTYTITFVTNGGTEIAPIEAEAGEEITPPSDPVLEGHTFDGWYRKADFSGGAQKLPTVMPAENRTYYAKFDANIYTLTLDVNGGTLSTTSYSLSYGTNLSAFLQDKQPTRGSLRFAGWYLGDRAVTQSDTMTGALTLVAQWEAPYTVEVYLQQLNADKTAASDNYLLSEEYSGDGWAMFGKEYDASIELDNYVLFPEYLGSVVSKTIEESGNAFKLYYKLKTRSITYDVNTAGDSTGEMAKEEYPHGAIVQLKDCAYGRNGYRFAAWSLHHLNFTQLPVTSFAITQDYKFYAFWDHAYTNEADSDDIIYVSSVLSAGMLGSVYRLDGGQKKEGFLENNAHIDWVLEFTFMYDEGDQVGRIDRATGTFRYRGEEEGVYLGYAYATEQYVSQVLYLDGYGEAVWGDVDGAGGIDFGNNFGNYSYDATYEDYRFDYIDIITQTATGEYFNFRISGEFPDGYQGANSFAGVFYVQGLESGTFLLFDVFYGELNYYYALELDGYGNAREVFFNPETEQTELLSEGRYLATDNYEDYMGEWEYIADSTNRELSRFILNAVAYGDGYISVYLMYDAALDGTLKADAGSARLVLGGYNAAAYYPNGISGNVISGAFAIEDEVNLTFIPYEDGVASGFMLFVVTWTPGEEYLGTFTLNTDGFIVTADGTLTGYLGTSPFVEIPARVTAIAADALNYMNTEVSLRSVIIPEGVLSIGARAFENNYTLSQAVFRSTTPIEIDWASTVDPFRWPKGDFVIIVPEGYEDIYRAAWADCPHKITSFAELNNRPEWEIEDGVLIGYNNKDDNPHDLDLKIPDEVTEIAAKVFFALDYIRSVDLNNVVSVGKDAFANCIGLVLVTAPNLKNVGAGAFALCTSLTQISLPAAESLGEEAFASCELLTSVTLGEKISEIGNAAFAYCATEAEDKTIFVIFEGTTAPAVGGRVFYGCVARRISVDTIETALQFYAAADWFSYNLSLWVREAAECELVGDWVDLAALQPVTFNGRAELFYFEVWLYDLKGSALTFYISDDSAIGYTTVSGTYENGVISFTYERQDYVLVRCNGTISYTSAEETLTLDLTKAEYGELPFLIPATLNNVPLTLRVTFNQITATDFIKEGRKYSLTFTLDNDRTFSYKATLADTMGPYTAKDGSVVSFRFSGSLIYATGTLTVDGFEIKGTVGWVATQEDDNTFNITIPWRSTTYLVTVVITGEDTFTYSWAVGSMRKVISAENGQGGVVVVYDRNGAITTMQLMLPPVSGGSNITVECTYELQEDGSYLFHVEFDEEFYDEVTGSFYYEPSPLNGTYQVVIDFDGETCTIIKTA